eukprot:429466_1
MKLFPEFAMMVQKWSGQQKWASLRGWERVQYAVKTTRMMKTMGASTVKFIDVHKRLNGIDTTAGNSFQQVTCQDINPKKKELSYDDFKDQYAAAFTKVTEDMEKLKKKKIRLKKLKKKKWRQGKNGGKLGDILGE